MRNDGYTEKWVVGRRSLTSPTTHQEVPRRALVTFEDAQLELLAYVRDRIRNGELTERSFARQIGISQPHAHNALKGVRTLSADVLDAILRHFHLSLLDLLTRPAPPA